MKRTIGIALLAGLLIAALGVVMVGAQAGVLDPGTAITNFTVMNLDKNDIANVTAYYVNSTGAAEVTVPVTIPAQSSYGFAAAQVNDLPDGWEGAVVVSADKEIVAFAQTRWSGGTSADQKTAAAYNGFTAGATKLYFPSLVARPTKQYSVLSIQSAESQAADTINFTITYYDRDGAQTGSVVNGTIAKGSQETYNLLDNTQLTESGFVADGWIGSAVVESTSPIAGVAITHWPDYSAAYSGVTGGGNKISLPSATMRCPANTTLNCSAAGVGPWLQYTGVVVQNMGATAADVTVTWYDRSGNTLHSFTHNIAANASQGFNTRLAANTADPNALWTALGGCDTNGENCVNDWNGSVVIESANEIIAIGNLQWTADHPAAAAAASYASATGGTQELFVPATFRTLSGTTYNQYTGLIVQNVGASACNNFTVQWFDRDGANLLEYTDSLNPNISHGYNTRTTGDIPTGSDPTDLTANFRGSVYINAPGCELAGIHNTVWPAQTDNTTYSAFGK
jgi:hypothetical protein